MISDFNIEQMSLPLGTVILENVMELLMIC